MATIRVAPTERHSPHLKTNGQSVLRAALTPRDETATKGGASSKVQDMSITDMEKALSAKPSRRIPEQVRDGHAPQTARALLEENRQLIQEKSERKALARKNSREFVERLLAQDRMTTEGDKAREIGRRHAQRELAQYYKAEIAEKEQAKASEYRSKVESGVEIQYFPFVEGETINKSREAKSAKMREEMRGFLNHQREKHPPRTDTLLAETSHEHNIRYGNSREGSVLPGDDVAPHMNRHPRFLSRAREHMSRRLHDAHVRKALEDKVLQTRAELESASQQREAERQQWEEGMQVNDALRYDLSQAKAMEKKKHAEILKSQMKERADREQRVHREQHADITGYYGPEEKELQETGLHREHCTELIKQMEVDNSRRCNSRNARLRQERRLIDNCMAEMLQDRSKERQKNVLHREVLTTTWKSQQKIKHAVDTLEGL